MHSLRKSNQTRSLHDLLECSLDSYFKKDNPAPVTFWGKLWERLTNWLTGWGTERKQAQALATKLKTTTDDANLLHAVEQTQSKTSLNSPLRWRLLKHLAPYYQINYRPIDNTTAKTFRAICASSAIYGGVIPDYQKMRNEHLGAAVLPKFQSDLDAIKQSESKSKSNEIKESSTLNSTPASTPGKRR